MRSKILNQELREKTKFLIIAVSKILLESRKIILEHHREIGFLLLDYGKEILELPEVKACAKIMLGDVAIRREFASRISDKSGKPIEKPPIRSIYEFYLRPFLSQYFMILKDVGLDQDTFNALYTRFEEYLYSDSLKYKIISPLAGFKSDVDVIELEKNLKIRRMSEEETNKLWKPRDAFVPPIIQPMDALALKYALESPFSHRKGSPLDRRILAQVFEGVVTAFRLFKSGTVDFFFTQEIPILWEPYGGIAYHFKKRADYLGLNYYLEKKEIDDFVEFWKEFRDTIVDADFHGHNYLRIALKRFNLGSEEKDLENKLIDFFVAFEALYLVEALELSYRLALRTATLLAESSQEKKEIFKFMRDAYTLRSQIVHGSPPKIRKKIVNLDDYVPKLENYLRRSITKYLRMIRDFKNQEKVLHSLDQEILE